MARKTSQVSNEVRIEERISHRSVIDFPGRVSKSVKRVAASKPMPDQIKKEFRAFWIQLPVGRRTSLAISYMRAI